MLLPARRQILERDLRIQILALVRVRENGLSNSRGNGSFEGNECFLFSFCHLSAFATLRLRSTRFPTVSQPPSFPPFFYSSNGLIYMFAGGKVFLWDFFWTKSTTRWRSAEWRLNSHPSCNIIFQICILKKKKNCINEETNHLLSAFFRKF